MQNAYGQLEQAKPIMSMNVEEEEPPDSNQSSPE
jgi:hypothetical protein